MKLTEKQQAALRPLLAEMNAAQARVATFINATALALDIDPMMYEFDLQTMSFQPREQKPNGDVRKATATSPA